MSSAKQFIPLSGFGRKEHILFCLVLFASLLLSPLTTIAEKKHPVNVSQPSSTEELLATNEQMIEQLIREIELPEENTHENGELADNPNPTSFISSIPNIRPIGGSITSNFGIRVHPIYHVSLFHSGIDFSVPEGTGVQTTGDGIVAFSGYDKGYGQKIIINHGYGYKTVYAHLSKPLVSQGQKVKRSEIIALSGNTGVSTGPHLHYEVRKDNARVNPTAYFFDGTNSNKFLSIKKTSPEEEGNNY